MNETINWKPLEELSEVSNKIDCCDFMYMGSVGDINLYKHRDTRSYLNIDSSGTFWQYNGGNYFQVSKELAIHSINK